MNAGKRRSAFIRVHSRLPKLPRNFLRLEVILFSALPIQTIGQAALPDLAARFGIPLR